MTKIKNLFKSTSGKDIIIVGLSNRSGYEKVITNFDDCIFYVFNMH